MGKILNPFASKSSAVISVKLKRRYLQYVADVSLSIVSCFSFEFFLPIFSLVPQAPVPHKHLTKNVYMTTRQWSLHIIRTPTCHSTCKNNIYVNTSNICKLFRTIIHNWAYIWFITSNDIIVTQSCNLYEAGHSALINLSLSNATNLLYPSLSL